MNRRGFLASLAAPYLAKFIAPSFEFWPKQNPSVIYFKNIPITTSTLVHDNTIYFLSRTGVHMLRGGELKTLSS